MATKQRASQCACAALLLAFPNIPVLAHIKWFAECKVADAPRPIGQVLNGTFVKGLLISIFAIYFFFLADRYIYKKGYWSRLDQRLRRLDVFATTVMRLSAAVFFLCLGLWHLRFGDSFYLTPELTTTSRFVPWLQLLLGVCALWRPAMAVTGGGIFVLYVDAARHYGIYHMLDYTIFLGIGYFFLVGNIDRGQWKKSGFIVLFAATGLTLAWAAIEKFAYPQWSYQILERNSDMLLGMSPYLFLLVSGFIEFNLAFVVLGATSIAGRLVALGLQSIFVLAIFKFGVVDAVGHLLIIAILLILVVRGPTDARNMMVLPDKSPWTEAYFMTGLYSLAFVMTFVLYYGLHSLAYGV
jgi:hypothetical protein